jgi:membrane protease YdiL (CAAX protease family)
MKDGEQTRRARGRALGNGEGTVAVTLGPALLILLLVAGLYLVGGIPLQLFLGEAGIALAQILFLALPPVLLVRAWGFDLRRTFYLAWPSGRQVLGGVLFLAGGTQMAWFLAWLQGLFIPVPHEFLEMMAEFLTADSAGRFLWLLFLVALVPSVCEEVLFRGVLLSGLRSRLPAVAAVVVSGLIFGLFHLAPETGFRILPTAWLGMVLAWVVVASGSLPLVVLLHFLNNGAILALMSIPATRELVMGTEEAPPLVLLPAAVALLVAGLVVLGRKAETTERSRRTSPSHHEGKA